MNKWAEMDEMCSLCGGHADVIQPHNRIKLCSRCYRKIFQKNKIGIVSGGFDPIHIGHVRMIKKAMSNCDTLYVIINNDNWLVTKKGYAFMPQEERREIVEAMLRPQDIIFMTAHKKDDTDKSVCDQITDIFILNKDENDEITYYNGGDRFEDNIPEKILCDKLGIKMSFNCGGGKIQSSTSLVNARRHKDERFNRAV